MKEISVSKILLASIMTLVLVASSGAIVTAEEEAKGSHATTKEMKGSAKAEMKGSAMGEEQDAFMAKWQEYATPAENHRVLDALVGSWDYEVKWWMDPNAEPEVSQGSSEIQWIMDGRFIQNNVKGVSMGQPFEGMGITGYNNEKKEYSSIWFDNMGTGMMKGSGQYDAATKTLTENGTYSCPLKGESDSAYRAVLTIVDQNHYTYEMFSTAVQGGEPFKTMAITYSRK